MADHWQDWLSLIGRWAHILTGIAWIGSSFFFMWLDSNLRPAEPPVDGVEGELFMVHSGGYYRVHKKLFGHGTLPSVLHWFKWEAAFTWITGIFLLGIIYYSGGTLMMVDEQIRALTATQAITIGIGSLIFSWFVYDGIWRFTGKVRFVPLILTACLILGVTYLLTNTLSGRAAYMHIGAMLGTWMVANVWIHIIPNQKRMLAEAQAGKTPNYSLGEQAKYRSVHNNYFTLPVISIMISNHHPVTFGHGRAWIILALIFLAGAFIRHTFNLKNVGKKYGWPLVPGFICFLIAIYMTSPQISDSPDIEEVASITVAAPLEQSPRVTTEPPPTIDSSVAPSGVTTLPSSEAPSQQERLPIRSFIKGRIFFVGTVPPKEKLKVPAGCLKDIPEVFKDDIVLGEGKTLQNAIVFVRKGLMPYKGALDTSEVVVDQKGCAYSPKVVAAMVGQPVVFVNSDSIFHNVRSHGKVNSSFNVGMPKKGQRIVRVFDKAEFVVNAKCSVHPWMSSYIGVFDHPWFSVTREKGEFLLQGLSAGEYEIVAWHPTLGEQAQTITIADGVDVNLDFTFKN